MQKARNQNENQRKTTPFFKKGVLKYEASKHALTISGGYYRCSLNCKGECKHKEEKQFKKDILERKFSRMASGFEIGGVDSKIMRKEVVKQILFGMMKAIDDENYYEDTLADATLEVIKQQVGSGKIKKSDLMDFQKAYMKQQVNDYPMILLGYLAGVIIAFSEPEKEINMGRTLSWISTEIFLSNDGKITSIKLERWGWFILNFIEKRIPGYIYKIKEKGIKILNAQDEITSLELDSAVDYMQEEVIRPEFKNKEALIVYSFARNLTKLARKMANASNEEIVKELTDLFQLYQTDMTMNMAVKIAQAQKAKLS